MFGRNEDPISLITASAMFRDRSWMAARQRDLKKCLREVEDALSMDDSRARARTLTEVGKHLVWSPAPASGELRTRLTVVYEKLMASGTKGRQPAEKGILTSLVLGADESLVSFFSGLFDVAIDRDRFSPQRKAFAAAGLGLLVQTNDSEAALTALLEATAHTNGDVSTAAVRALRAAYAVDIFDDIGNRGRGGSMRPAPPPEVIECLMRTALEHPAFLGRFHARRTLQFLGADAPQDHPKGAYQFKMTVERYRGFSARLLVPSSAALDSLLWLSLAAMGWDSDHLHSFYLSGKKHDPLTEYPSDHDEGCPEEPGLNIGQLGLAPKVKFICLYDFGDNNVFKYTCEKVIPTVAGLSRGSVVERKGRPPEQYPSW